MQSRERSGGRAQDVAHLIAASSFVAFNFQTAAANNR
jgi:hypothetical protein